LCESIDVLCHDLFVFCIEYYLVFHILQYEFCFLSAYLFTLAISDSRTGPGSERKESSHSCSQTLQGSSGNALKSCKGDISATCNLKSFTFNDLKNATRNFRADSLLGEGGFGYVFKGWLDENTLAPCKSGTGMVVAVKKLKSESCQGHREWLVCSS